MRQKRDHYFDVNHSSAWLVRFSQCHFYILMYCLLGTPDGIQVSLGFFQDIFIPPYWMLRTSKYENRTGLWVWTPHYDEEEDGEEEEDDGEKSSQDVDGADPAAVEEAQPEEEDSDRYEFTIGAQIRFKVKSINFTQVTSTAKGMQATTTTTAQAAHPNMVGGRGGNAMNDAGTANPESADKLAQPVRKRSVSVDLTESQNLPATMHVVASICEDGLGLSDWW